MKSSVESIRKKEGEGKAVWGLSLVNLLKYILQMVENSIQASLSIRNFLSSYKTKASMGLLDGSAR